jgi:hypothetical protein
MTVIVQIDNAYECSRRSISVKEVDPPPGLAPDVVEQWFEEVVYDLTGDGHDCGQSENAIYEATVIAAPEMPQLVGAKWEWG